jgi:hypothetical protein
VIIFMTNKEDRHSAMVIHWQAGPVPPHVHGHLVVVRWQTQARTRSTRASLAWPACVVSHASYALSCDSVTGVWAADRGLGLLVFFCEMGERRDLVRL